jgi:hypothetical protein
MFSNSSETEILGKNIKDADMQVNALKEKMRHLLDDPDRNDPVYKICQRCFHKTDKITLSRDTEVKRSIKRRAFRRFLYGYPPRKRDDTSIGDAINWEWIVECASACQSEIHIVSRDADYGITLEEKSYLNDQLLQEFKERISQERKIQFHTKVTEALKLFAVTVTKAEEKEEMEVLQKAPTLPPTLSPAGSLEAWDDRIFGSGFFRNRPWLRPMIR